MNRLHNPVSKDEIILFCRNNIHLFDELLKINNEDTDMSGYDWNANYNNWRRRRIAKAKQILPIIKNTFNHKEPYEALWRMLDVFAKNIDEIKGLRKEGYYWCKYKNEWIILKYSLGAWVHGELMDSDFQEIDNTPVTRK